MAPDQTPAMLVVYLQKFQENQMDDHRAIHEGKPVPSLPRSTAVGSTAVGSTAVGSGPEISPPWQGLLNYNVLRKNSK